MTNEQLTEHIVELEKYKAQAEQEHKSFRSALEKIQESLDAFNKLAEDVHIMALNMTTLQEKQNDIDQKVDGLIQKDYKKYEENKKIINQKILDKGIGALIGIGGTVLVFFAKMFLEGGM